MSGREITRVSEGLHAVGAAVPADHRQTWVDPESGRWLPLQVFVLRTGDRAVVVDTSVIALQKEIQRGLTAALNDATSIDVVTTRYNFDTLVNLPWLLRTFPVDRVHTSLQSNFILGTGAVMKFVDAFEDAQVDAHVRSIADVEPILVAPNQDVEIGGRRMRCIFAPLRILHTTWMYDYGTRSLFCSDSWGLLTTATAEAPPLFDDRALDRSRLESSLRRRLDWLAGADTGHIRKSLDELFTTLPVDRLCPSHGCVIEGSHNVRAILEATVAVLARLQNEVVRPLVVGAPPYPTRVYTAAELKGTVA